MLAVSCAGSQNLIASLVFPQLALLRLQPIRPARRALKVGSPAPFPAMLLTRALTVPQRQQALPQPPALLQVRLKFSTSPHH